jgi:hypothetical protein
MRTSRWFSDAFGRLSARERRVLAGGAVTVTAIVLLTQLALPWLDHWSEREARIDTMSERVSRLEALAAGETGLAAAVEDLAARRDTAARRLLPGSTPALAASALQTLLNGYAERSGVGVVRIEPEPAEPPAEGESLGRIPIRLTARGDVYGLVDLLFYLQNGETLLVIDELSVGSGRSFGRNETLMNWTLRLHGLYAAVADAAAGVGA